MANFPQSGTSYNQYFGYGSGAGCMQYDAAQNKWVQGANSANQSQQNQLQMYQNTPQAAEYYAAASAYNYGNLPYGQQQNYSTGAVDSGTSATGSGNTNSASISTAATGAKNTGMSATANNVNNSNSNFVGTGSGGLNGTAGFSGSGAASFGNTVATTSGTSTTGTFAATNNGTGTVGFNAGGTFGNNMPADAANMMSQMFSGVYGTNTNNGTQNSTMNNNTGSNMNGQNSANNANYALGQLNQTFGAGANFGNGTPGDASGGNVGAGFNALNSGMMSFLQQTLLQQANGAAGFGNMGNTWGTSDGDGGYYAPPMDTNSQSLSQYGDGGEGHGGGKKSWKKWSGKDSNKQDFYGNRFAQLYTGAPGVMGGQQQGGKGKRLQDGVRINVKGEKVVDVEVPLSLYSRWGQLRKVFSRQDTEVVKHLLAFHDESCEDCLQREQQSQKKDSSQDRKINEEESGFTEEDMALKQIMGFGSFNTTRGAMVEGNQVDSKPGATANAKSRANSSLEKSAGFIGPKKLQPKQPKEAEAKGSKDGSETDANKTLTEEEKKLMEKLGWSVFNKKKGADSDVGGGGDDEKVDGSAA